MGTTSSKTPSHWVADDSTATCDACGTEFTLLRRRHHCRCCGHLFCAACTLHREFVPSRGLTTERVRICNLCFTKEVAPLQVSSRAGRHSGPQRSTLRRTASDMSSSPAALPRLDIPSSMRQPRSAPTTPRGGAPRGPMDLRSNPDSSYSGGGAAGDRSGRGGSGQRASGEASCLSEQSSVRVRLPSHILSALLSFVDGTKRRLVQDRGVTGHVHTKLLEGVWPLVVKFLVPYRQFDELRVAALSEGSMRQGVAFSIITPTWLAATYVPPPPSHGTSPASSRRLLAQAARSDKQTVASHIVTPALPTSGCVTVSIMVEFASIETGLTGSVLSRLDDHRRSAASLVAACEVGLVHESAIVQRGNVTKNPMLSVKDLCTARAPSVGVAGASSQFGGPSGGGRARPAGSGLEYAGPGPTLAPDVAASGLLSAEEVAESLVATAAGDGSSGGGDASRILRPIVFVIEADMQSRAAWIAVADRRGRLVSPSASWKVPLGSTAGKWFVAVSVPLVDGVSTSVRLL